MAVYGRVNWEALDRRNAPVKMRLSSTVAAVEHNGPPDMADDVSVTYYKDGELHRGQRQARGGVQRPVGQPLYRQGPAR